MDKCNNLNRHVSIYVNRGKKNKINENFNRHIDHINKLRWRNNQLLSCSEDKKINLMEFV